jgi:hypothetical protein
MEKSSQRPVLAQNRVPVIVKVVVSIRVPPALKIFAVPEPLKELRVEPKVMPEVTRISADKFPVSGGFRL